MDRYSIEGKYTDKLFAKNLKTGEEWLVFTAPPKPPNHEVMYHMNLFALQLMAISDELKVKLPPCDGRFRGDTLYWDKANLDMATKEKDRLEKNQRQRRKLVKDLMFEDPKKESHWDLNDERTFYNP